MLQINVDLLKFWVDQVNKMAAFYFALTGAIASYVLSNPNIPYIDYVVMLPIFMGVSFGIMLLTAQFMGIFKHFNAALDFYAGIQTEKECSNYNSKKENAEYDYYYPAGEPLQWMCWLYSFCYFITAGTMAIAFYAKHN